MPVPARPVSGRHEELDAFVELTDSVEQHPVLMDCARALGKPRRVDELWEELAAASPPGALVTEGRIVLAGTRADQGRLTEAIAILDRRGGQPNRVQDHHVRVWYVLAISTSARATCPRRVSCSCASAATTRASPTPPSASPLWGEGAGLTSRPDTPTRRPAACAADGVDRRIPSAGASLREVPRSAGRLACVAIPLLAVVIVAQRKFTAASTARSRPSEPSAIRDLIEK